MNIGIIGAGAIAQFLMGELNKRETSMRVTSVLVRDMAKYTFLRAQGITLYTDLEKFLQSPIDIVVEAANIAAVEQLVPTVIAQKPVVLISVGALANESLLAALQQAEHQLYVPSGAVGGLDLLQNAHALGTVKTVQLTTRKPASSLIEETINGAQIIFEGSAKEAIARYPKNMNVSIVLALASIGFEQTSVTLIADPHVSQNIHEIVIKGDFGEATVTVKNNPLPQNPKTSYLAAMSIVGMLNKIESKLIIG